MQTRAPIQQRTRGRVRNLHVIIPQAPAKPRGAVRLRLILTFTPVFKKISLCFLFISSLSPRNTRGARQGDNVACWGRSGTGENGEVSEGVDLPTPYYRDDDMQHAKIHMFTSLQVTMCGSMDSGYAVANEQNLEGY